MQVARTIKRTFLALSAMVVAPSLGAEGVSKADQLRTEDPSGVVMTITAMLVVFFGLAVLYLAFKGVGRLSQNLSERNKRKAQAPKSSSNRPPASVGAIPPEVSIAIGLALYEATEEVHDQEGDVITISHTQKSSFPSAWSNKAFNQRTPSVLQRHLGVRSK